MGSGHRYDDTRGRLAMLGMKHENIWDWTRCGLAMGWFLTTAIIYILSVGLRGVPPELGQEWWGLGTAVLTAFVAGDVAPAMRDKLLHGPGSGPKPPGEGA